jgi:hypothetical protein
MVRSPCYRCSYNGLPIPHRSGTNSLVRLLTSKAFPTSSHWQYYIKLLGSERGSPLGTSSMMKFYHRFSPLEYLPNVCHNLDASFRLFTPFCPPCHTHAHTSLRLTHFTLPSNSSAGDDFQPSGTGLSFHILILASSYQVL